MPGTRNDGTDDRAGDGAADRPRTGRICRLHHHLLVAGRAAGIHARLLYRPIVALVTIPVGLLRALALGRIHEYPRRRRGGHADDTRRGCDASRQQAGHGQRSRTALACSEHAWKSYIFHTSKTSRAIANQRHRSSAVDSQGAAEFAYLTSAANSRANLARAMGLGPCPWGPGRRYYSAGLPITSWAYGILI